MKSLPVLFALLLMSGLLSFPVFGGEKVVPPAGMVYIKAGNYTPLFRSGKETGLTLVQPFFLDRYPVTNAEFLEFVRRNPGWRRSRIKALFADQTYLKHWAGDTLPGSAAPAAAPVTHVSWFAARAYAKWKGKRLPTTAEWEYVAAASEKSFDGSKDPAYTSRILSWYAKPAPNVLADVSTGFKNAWGVCGMHGLIWEWVEDFNSALVNGDSRNDTGVERNMFCGGASIRATDAKDYAAFMRYGFRSSLLAHYCVSNLGFRCARDVTIPSSAHSSQRSLP